MTCHIEGTVMRKPGQNRVWSWVYFITQGIKNKPHVHIWTENLHLLVLSARRDMANYRGEKTCGFHLVFGVREVWLKSWKDKSRQTIFDNCKQEKPLSCWSVAGKKTWFIRFQWSSLKVLSWRGFRFTVARANILENVKIDSGLGVPCHTWCWGGRCSSCGSQAQCRKWIWDRSGYICTSAHGYRRATITSYDFQRTNSRQNG